MQQPPTVGKKCVAQNARQARVHLALVSRVGAHRAPTMSVDDLLETWCTPELLKSAAALIDADNADKNADNAAREKPTTFLLARIGLDSSTEALWGGGVSGGAAEIKAQIKPSLFLVRSYEPSSWYFELVVRAARASSACRRQNHRAHTRRARMPPSLLLIITATMLPACKTMRVGMREAACADGGNEQTATCCAPS